MTTEQKGTEALVERWMQEYRQQQVQQERQEQRKGRWWWAFFLVLAVVKLEGLVSFELLWEDFTWWLRGLGV